VVGVVVDVVVVVGMLVDLVVGRWHVCSMNSDKMALRSLKSATVKTVLCCPGGDAMPRSSSSLMSRPIPRATRAQIHSMFSGCLRTR